MSERPSIVRSVQQELGAIRTHEVHRLVAHVLDALLPLLTDDERHVFAEVLPADLAAHLSRKSNRDDDVNAFYYRVARRAEVTIPRAIEIAGIVCASLAARLDDDRWHRIVRDQPPAMRELFSRGTGLVPTATSHGAGHATSSAHVASVSGSRPGSDRPVSEAAPPGAQAQSVVNALNPHGERKLSSGR